MYVRTCPRCEKNKIPSNEHPGEYPGAMSRIAVDGRRIIEICSMCGEDEGFEGFMKPEGYTPVGQWPIEDWMSITKDMQSAVAEHRKLNQQMEQMNKGSAE